jgi:hypothetical protein
MSVNKTADLFGVPDELNTSATVSDKKTPKKTARKKDLNSPKLDKLPKASSPSSLATSQNLLGQGFLPGLSRRGRPRLAKPISAVERTAEHRRKRIANGAKRVEIILDAHVSQALDRLAAHHQEARSDVIATLIRKAASRLKVASL